MGTFTYLTKIILFPTLLVSFWDFNLQGDLIFLVLFFPWGFYKEKSDLGCFHIINILLLKF